MLYHARFRCLSARRVHANAHRSRVLSQGPLVLSPTRYKRFLQGDELELESKEARLIWEFVSAHTSY